MKTLSTKYQKGLCAGIVILFCFIVYRTYVINRLYYTSFQEALTPGLVKKNKAGAPKAGGNSGNMIAKTGKKIEIIQKRGKGQAKKLKDMQVTIEHVNKELDRKIKGE